MSADVPAGFAPVMVGGHFIIANGPIFMRHEGDGVQFGFRVEPRHANTMGPYNDRTSRSQSGNASV